ncbi:ABC transporter ATP-binding protein [Chitiniphilus eburneus]|uniref:ABC transporter ATP-binding protein n=1 Tax=Chitiniphilus eburneus TaxID=2571148 RepID=A0A4U0PLY8_9NEIS|nr:ABC transporter ATP-binding protein [Chitiniphilus eburneus]TJZ63944.1 ABC transporter ATP-binding protein [Chitiniphilus eburneus]
MNLHVEGLKADYRERPVLTGVDLVIASGEVVAIVGANGCGKSTLLRSMARLHRPAAGRVLVDGEDLWAMRPGDAARRVGLLPQFPQAPAGITVEALVGFGRYPYQGLFRQWSREDEAAVAQALRETDMLDHAARPLERLSGGQRQRAWLAMVLAQQTPILMLDEPTSMLDLGHQVEVLRLVRGLATAGRTVVMVLHDLAAAARYADTLVALHDGKVLAHGAPRSVVTAQRVRTLYGIDAHVIAAPDDGAPVVVPVVA